jgi:tetratricopeptide (TPR) repeat protein
MTRSQLLQSLIYTQSQPFEIKHEQACSTASLDEEDLIIRFIKHLVTITASRNSFYVTVGIGRLLHSYTTAEAMSIYNVVIQDPDRIKDDAYYRFCKSELMRELIKRFGNYINKIRCARGEERFESDNKDRQPVELVRRCLKQFTPWDTSCVAPEDFDPNKDELSALVFNGENPDQEHPIEMRRMHSIIHPGCYSRITGALRYDLPDERLSVPRFNLAERRSNGMRKRADRFNPPELSEERKKAILEEVSEQEARRKRVRPRELKIMVDWEEVAILELSGESRVKFEVDKWAGMIKVCAEDEKGELVIGIYRLDWYEEVEEGLIEEGEMELEGRERLKFVLRMRRGRYGEYDGAEVEIGCGKSKVVEEAREYLREMREGREAIKRKGKEEKEVSYSRLHRRYVFGEMSIDAMTDNSFSSTSVFAAPSLRIRLAGLSLGIVTKQALFDYGSRLASLAENAQFLRQADFLEEISERLTTLSLPQFENIGFYYKGLFLRLKGRTEEARSLFEKVFEEGPASYRARAIHSFGATCLDKGDYDSAHMLFTEAGRLSHRNEYSNPLAFLQSHWGLGILQSIDGDHKTSLANFESLRPMVEVVASRYPSLWFSYQNGLAVELMEVGRIEEAERASRIALASPFARLYPEWSETARDLEKKTRRASPSVVSLSNCNLPRHGISKAIPSERPARPVAVNGNIIRLQAETCPLPSARRAQQPARILAFRERSGIATSEDLLNDPAYMEKRYQIMVAAAESTDLQLLDEMYAIIIRRSFSGNKPSGDQ